MAGGTAAIKGAEPLTSETKRRVRLAEHQRKGFESAWNEYYDCYASTTYLVKPLIKLEDIGYHLYLKKNINPTNPSWELPSFRQQKKILGLSQDKLQGIEERLQLARLLVKESGRGKGEKGENVANDYLLYEPLELLDFLLAVAAGELPATLNEKGRKKLASLRTRFDQPAREWPQQDVSDSGTPPGPERGTSPVPLSGPPPAPASGTDNRRCPTALFQQLEQQQSAGTLTAAMAANPATGEGTVVVELPDALVERGMTRKVAEQLVATTSPATIARQTEVYDFLREAAPGDPKLTAGRLRRMIEEEWAPPPDFVPAATRAALAQAATEAREQRRHEGAAAAAAQAQREEEARAARQAALEAVGLTHAYQLTWQELARAEPSLPPVFGRALFYPPEGEGTAVLVFEDRNDHAVAQSVEYTATRAQIKRRVAERYRRPQVQLHYLLYDDLMRLVSEDVEPIQSSSHRNRSDPQGRVSTSEHGPLVPAGAGRGAAGPRAADILGPRRRAAAQRCRTG